jgi:hypothetical protein
MAPATEITRAIPATHGRLDRVRLTLEDGHATTIHVARFPRDAVRAAVVRFPRPRRVVDWCALSGVRHAIVAGFFVRPEGRPLGELRLDGIAHDHEPFASPWGGRRGCVTVKDGQMEIASRPEFADSPAGDLLEVGPLLVRNGVSVLDGLSDPEGFSSMAHQFDSDITDGRYPRAALGVTEEDLLAVAADGRAPGEAGLALAELADAMAVLGSRTAINLDGGGSTSLVFDGVLRNAPREEHGILIPGGRPVATALTFEPCADA